MEELSPTRRDILAELRHRPMTVTDLVARLGLTRNAILVPLSDLEARGLVRRRPPERTGRAGKPATRYEIAPRELERISPAYQALAPHLFAALVPPGGDERARAMADLGRRMFAELAASLGGPERVSLDAALAFLSRQGAQIETRREGADLLVLSHSCPIGQLVRVDSCICSAIAAFLGLASGRPVTDRCILGDKLTCRFQVAGMGKRDPIGTDGAR